MLLDDIRRLSPPKISKSRSCSKDSIRIDRGSFENSENNISTDSALPIPSFNQRIKLFPITTGVGSEISEAKTIGSLFPKKPSFCYIPSHQGDTSTQINQHANLKVDPLSNPHHKHTSSADFGKKVAYQNPIMPVRPRIGMIEIHNGQSDLFESTEFRSKKYVSAKTYSVPKSILVSNTKFNYTNPSKKAVRSHTKKVSFSKNRMVLRYQTNPEEKMDIFQPSSPQKQSNKAADRFKLMK